MTGEGNRAPTASRIAAATPPTHKSRPRRPHAPRRRRPSPTCFITAERLFLQAARGRHPFRMSLAHGLPYGIPILPPSHPDSRQ
jgi:hypothetical protein